MDVRAEAEGSAFYCASERPPPYIATVIVTRNRPALLQSCLEAVLRQTEPTDELIVVDNASGPETSAILAQYPVRTLRMVRNTGGAGGFWAGITAALHRGAEWIWLMDDDGRPAYDTCLAQLLASANTHQADLVGALMLDVDRPDRLAFPVRINGRTVFDTATLERHGPLPGFAHLFNGVLVRADLFRRIGLPDPRFLIRGDEVEFLYRARQAGARVILETGASFLHPGSQPEIHPILFNQFYAVVPHDPTKRFLQFRNRGYIFRRYRMWGWLLADVIRYGWYFLLTRRGDVRGFQQWTTATAQGLRGRFMRPGRGRPTGTNPTRRS